MRCVSGFFLVVFAVGIAPSSASSENSSGSGLLGAEYSAFSEASPVPENKKIVVPCGTTARYIPGAAYALRCFYNEADCKNELNLGITFPGSEVYDGFFLDAPRASLTAPKYQCGDCRRRNGDGIEQCYSDFRRYDDNGALAPETPRYIIDRSDLNLPTVDLPYAYGIKGWRALLEPLPDELKGLGGSTTCRKVMEDDKHRADDGFQSAQGYYCFEVYAPMAVQLSCDLAIACMGEPDRGAAGLNSGGVFVTKFDEIYRMLDK